MVVVILVGVPMWWKTTEVYRVPLPYSEIENLSQIALKASLSIGIFTFDQNHAQNLLNDLKTHYKNNDIWDIHFVHITDVENVNELRTPAALETRLLKKFNIKPGDFLIYEWPKLIDEDILMTCDRSALITQKTKSEKIIQLLDLYVLQTYRIHGIINEQNNGYKSTPSQSEYDVLISILNPAPEKMDVKWNIRSASDIYLRPFLENVNQVSNFILKTQWRYQVAFDFSPKQIKDNSTFGRHYTISRNNLPHMITSIEKNLGQSISDNTQINIVVYVPPCNIAPLYILDENNRRISNNSNINSFISPKWGSVIIYNPPEEACLLENSNSKQKTSFHINSNDVMQIILFHLQKLLDIYTDVNANGIKLADIEQLTPRTWEYDAYIRRSAINHIFTSNRTLRSLIQLLDNISYIVINDNVGKDVDNAYEKIIMAKDSLLSGDLLNASKFAKEAFMSSERAFFDASLLAQLYFPDEQKYAVYIPLFLPIMVPVITSLAGLKKYYVKKSCDEKLKTL